MDARSWLDAAARELYAMGNGELSSVPGECLPFRLLVVGRFADVDEPRALAERPVPGLHASSRGLAELLSETADVAVLSYRDAPSLWDGLETWLGVARNEGAPFTLVLLDGALPPDASSLAISTMRSSRFGRNSWSGGSIVRIVTGSPCIALNTP